MNSKQNDRVDQLDAEVSKHFDALTKIMTEASLNKCYGLHLVMLVDAVVPDNPNVIVRNHGIGVMLGLGCEVLQTLREHALTGDDEAFVEAHKAQIRRNVVRDGLVNGDGIS